jgi:hypothetical protein
MNNPWISYIGRSYELIKASLLQRLRVKVPEMTDTNPSNLFIVLLDMFASIADVLNYYIDNTVRELYPITARRFSSMLKLAHFLNYSGKAMIHSSVNLKFYLDNPASSSFTLNAFLNITDESGNSWITTRKAYFPKGFRDILVPAMQVTRVEDEEIGVSDGQPSQSFQLPTNYDHGSLEVTIDDIAWERKDVLGLSAPTDKHFMVSLSPNNETYLRFGNGVNGAIPDNEAKIFVNYYSTKGPEGNVEINSITTLVSSVVVPGGTELKVTNPFPSYGGKEKEGLAELRTSIPLSLRTLNRAVTRQDYEDMARLAPGVRAAKLSYSDCEAPLDIYIAPHEGGLPSDALLASTKSYVENRGIFTIEINTKPAGEARVRVDIRATGNYGISSQTVSEKVNQALQELYSPLTSRINQPIRISDIIAKAHNLPEINNVILNWVYVEPYLRCETELTSLEYEIEMLSGITTVHDWRLVYLSEDEKYSLLRDGVQTYSDIVEGETKEIPGYFNLLISGLTTTSEDNIVWRFKTYPYNDNIELSDFSIPVYDSDNSTVTAQEITIND